MDQLRLATYDHLDRDSRVAFNRFCMSLATRSEPASKNMYCLPELIAERFSGDKGMLLVIYDNDRIIGCSGAYVSDFSPDIGLLGCRAWLEPEYRSKQIVRNLVLPAQREWATQKGLKLIALTFNDYNRNLVSLFKRQIVKREPRSPQHMFFFNMFAVNYPVVIQYTPQWVIFELLDPAFLFDWDTIKYRTPDLVE